VSDTASALRSTLLERIRADTPIPDPEWRWLARVIFEHQYSCNAPYRAFCERRGIHPHSLTDWEAIPAVPTDAFKATPLVCGGPAEARIVFRTSGTTQGTSRGEHFLRDLALYDAALRSSWAFHLLPDCPAIRMLSLVPTPEVFPDSSLSYMIQAIRQEFGAPGSGYFADASGIDVPGLNHALRSTETAGEPVCLLGTSFAFVHWLDTLGDTRFQLPTGSRIMDTGGSKGRSREVSPDDLRDMFADRLGVPPEWCVNEYGMTEMGSQFYDAVAGVPGPRVYRPPAWVRTRAADPETLRLLPDGEVGVLRHWDLANLDSVMVLQTADLGVCEPGGFRVIGRARGAEARGCSLAMDELLRALGSGSHGQSQHPG
jgi:hypothetical protein